MSVKSIKIDEKETKIKKAPLSWKFKQEIGGRTFIIYENKKCRIDDNEKFETCYYSGTHRLDWWEEYKKAVGEPTLPAARMANEIAMDKAWIAFIGW